MFTSLRSKLNKKWFRARVRGVFKTPRINCDESSGLIILSQVHHPDLAMYLVAAKSFARHVKPRKFVIIDDGLEANDRQILVQHFEHIEFHRSEDIEPGVCPRGSCWERLLGIADFNDTDYVVQLDADTVTLNPPNQVVECISKNRCFTLGTPDGNGIVERSVASRIASTWASNHVQAKAEQVLVHLPDELGEYYVRGCAGFAGFGVRSLTREKIYAFSDAMVQLLGTAKWGEWGSEQVTSNFMVANSPNALVLPINEYPFWRQGVDIGAAKFVHFFGTHRFKGGQYIRSSRHIVNAITQ